MTENHSVEVERLLLYVSDARDRAAKTIAAVERDGGEPHIVDALREARDELDRVHRSLTQRTFYAVAADALTLKA